MTPAKAHSENVATNRALPPARRAEAAASPRVLGRPNWASPPGPPRRGLRQFNLASGQLT